jgi:hypothetical protein
MGEACSMDRRDDKYMGKYEDERILGMVRYIWEDNIKINR